jgi:hypothetical protein
MEHNAAFTEMFKIYDPGNEAKVSQVINSAVNQELNKRFQMSLKIDTRPDEA